MPTLNDLRLAAQREPCVRNALFDYHYSNGFFGGADEYNARLNFEVMMQDPARSAVLLNTYLPEYNRQVQLGQFNTQVAQPRPRATDPVLNRSLTKAATAGAAGLTALLVSTVIDEPMTRHLVQIVSGTTVAASLAGAAIAYARSALTRTS